MQSNHYQKLEEKTPATVEAPWKVAIAKLRLTLKKLEFIEYRYGLKTNTAQYGPEGKYPLQTLHTRQRIRDLYQHILSAITVEQHVLDPRTDVLKTRYSPSTSLRHPEQIIRHIKQVLVEAEDKIALDKTMAADHPEAILKQLLGFCQDHLNEHLPTPPGFFHRAAGTYYEYITDFQKQQEKLFASNSYLITAENVVNAVMKDHLLLLNASEPLPPPPKPVVQADEKPAALPAPASTSPKIQLITPELKRKKTAESKAPATVETMVPPGLTIEQAYTLRRQELRRRLQSSELPALQLQPEHDHWQDMHDARRKRL